MEPQPLEEAERQRLTTMKRLLSIIILLAVCLTAALAQRQKPVAARLMTFNIRTENKGDGRNNWEMRYQEVGAFISKSKSDIVGLQEVKHRQLIDLTKLLAGYNYVGVARDDSKEGGEYNPILYNSTRFNLLGNGTFWLSPTPAMPSYGWGASYRRIATWAILQDKETMKCIIVLNTHLDHNSEKARINGAALIKERISRMNNELPVVLMGDMNSTSDSPTYAKLATAIFPLQDVCKAGKMGKGPDYTFHAFGQLPPDQRPKVDHIFISDQVKVKASAIHDSSLGKGAYLSDHNALTADIIY